MVLEDFGLNISSDEGKVDIGIIDDFEKKIGYKLPVLYKQIISKHNMLYLKESSFRFINFFGIEDEGGCFFKGFGDIPYEKIEDANENFENPEYYGELGLVIFGVHGNGDYICFDYRANTASGNPKIVYVYHDQFEELSDGRTRMVINDVADSFEEFLGMLY